MPLVQSASTSFLRVELATSSYSTLARCILTSCLSPHFLSTCGTSLSKLSFLAGVPYCSNDDHVKADFSKMIHLPFVSSDYTSVQSGLMKQIHLGVQAFNCWHQLGGYKRLRDIGHRSI